jgi:hypothetical protein
MKTTASSDFMSELEARLAVPIGDTYGNGNPHLELAERGGFEPPVEV